MYFLPERWARSYPKQNMFQPTSRECGTLSRRLSCCPTSLTPAQIIQSNKVSCCCQSLAKWIGLLSIQIWLCKNFCVLKKLSCIWSFFVGQAGLCKQQDCVNNKFCKGGHSSKKIQTFIFYKTTWPILT